MPMRLMARRISARKFCACCARAVTHSEFFSPIPNYVSPQTQSGRPRQVQ